MAGDSKDNWDRTPSQRVEAIYQKLADDLGFFDSTLPLQFASLPLASVPASPTGIADRLTTAAERLEERAGWFGPLNTPVRFVVASILVRERISVGDFFDLTRRADALFDDHGLDPGDIYTVAAQLILYIRHPEARVTPECVKRLAAIHEAFSENHWWLTSTNDYPTCALLVYEEGAVPDLAQSVEHAYQSLAERGFDKGDPLQLATHILYLSDEPVDRAVSRMAAIYEALDRADISTGHSGYDEAAILALLRASPESVVQAVLDRRARFLEMEPAPTDRVAFSLACGATFLELLHPSDPRQLSTDVLAVGTLQAIHAAQVAASAAAAAAAANAATVAATC